MNGLNQKLQRMFDSDSAIMFEALSRMLASIGPGRLAGPEIDRAFRAAHSIKSEAGFLRIGDVAEAAHRLEDSLSGVREADGVVDDDAAASLRRGVRTLADALGEYRSGRTNEPSVEEGSAGAPSSGDDRRSTGADAGVGSDASAGSPVLAAAARAERGMLREARARGEHVYRVVVGISTAPELRYARGFLVVNNLELSCAVVRTEPEVDRLATGDPARLELIVTTPSEEDVARDAVHRAVHVDEVELLEVTELSFAELLEDEVEISGSEQTPSDESERVTVSVETQEEVGLYVDEILGSAEEALRGSGGEEDRAERLEMIRRYARALRDRVGWTARVQLLDLFRELRSSSVRYAAAQRKRVRVVVGGNGAVVPPAVGDTLLEAVMHLIRNSIDHGVGTIEERARLGRHPAATVKVRVDRAGGRVRIVVQDDGKGIDEAAVRERAADAQSPLLTILARPGFSMRSSPDRSSGRGVGLDNVVHTVRTLLGGEIKLVNRPGEGMTFVIAVSGMTRLVHVYVVESAGVTFAVPSAMIVSHGRLERRRVKRDSFGSLYYDHDGRTLALSTVGGRTPSLGKLSDEAVTLIVRSGSELRAILVDAVLGEETVVREDARTRRVYSRLLGREASFVFPPSLASDEASSTVRA
ncbi:MAG: ATP-binding protein [Spirochaetota bacterium]